MYVPRFSASVRVNHNTKINDSKNSKVLSVVKKMADNILSKIDPDRLIRLTIDNNEGMKENLNKMIGRTAHICYLDNPVVATQLVFTLMPYFT
jgi:phosphoribosylformylglycinamidine (FGAM) synthase PurS component